MMDNWPEQFKDKMRMRFLEICSTILYSDDMRKVNHAYNAIFTEYRSYILSSDDIIKASIFEEVIFKLLNDEETGLFEQYGIYNSPFMRYIALIKEYDMKINRNTRKTIHVRTTNDYPPYLKENHFNPRSYLFAFFADHKNDIKNKTLRNLIRQSFSNVKEK